MSGFPADSPLVAKVVASPNQTDRVGPGRPDMIVLHYTGMTSADDALARLCSREAKVSSHYLVFEDGRIFQLVPEARRASHAGVSSWEGETDINSRSIGIEIVNPGHDDGYPDFSVVQIDAVIALCRDILARRPMRPDRVVAHSDVAPSRKQDPGEKFPWARLHAAGVGHWVEPVPPGEARGLAIGDSGPAVAELQGLLARYGYGIAASGQFDQAMHDVVVAFQRHFRPARVDGIADASTAETLRRLLATGPGVLD
ncbi:MAG TPA: N-acetylmuramoyl-L-alanine amidase [Xanthobacteraceae bacterium]|nr:N-acetylmuramoyl-L-alanine amidase [Xanthobacteraceae bacterium]